MAGNPADAATSTATNTCPGARPTRPATSTAVRARRHLRTVPALRTHRPGEQRERNQEREQQTPPRLHDVVLVETNVVVRDDRQVDDPEEHRRPEQGDERRSDPSSRTRLAAPGFGCDGHVGSLAAASARKREKLGASQGPHLQGRRALNPSMERPSTAHTQGQSWVGRGDGDVFKGVIDERIPASGAQRRTVILRRGQAIRSSGLPTFLAPMCTVGRRCVRTSGARSVSTPGTRTVRRRSSCGLHLVQLAMLAGAEPEPHLVVSPRHACVCGSGPAGHEAV